MSMDLLFTAPLAIQIHAFGAMSAFGLGSAQMLLPKGRTAHIIMGWVWVVLMVMVASSAFFIRGINHGSFSPVHLFIPLTIFGLYGGLSALYRKDGPGHGKAMRGLFSGALVLAGLFTFFPGRLMWAVVFGA
ncbi:MAG: hypothetical protein COA84_06980 [Robiginitomaculum sp.]|nr:MAG: hypothetical protein COA84_06980 [Robiginitomaculum sp.]